MYRLRVRPWEFDATPGELIEVAGRLGTGRALELGCGTGRQAVEMAKLGLDVTAVDYVDRAIEESRARAKAAGAKIKFLVADVTRLTEVLIGDGFDLVYDNKCFHGLPEASRGAYVNGVANACHAGATYLLFALTLGRFRSVFGMPRGIDPAKVKSTFAPHFATIRQRPPRRGPFEPAFYEMRREHTP